MQINLKGLVVALLMAFAFGWYTKPEKVRIEKQISTVEEIKKDETKDVKTDTNRDKHTEKVTTEVIKPDGTRETTTRIVEDTSTAKRSDTTSDNREETAKTTSEKNVETRETGYSKLNISLLAGAQASLNGGISFGPVVYGGHISRPLIGPITMGIFGLSSGVGGVSVGLLF